MTAENLYITLMLSNYALIFFKYMAPIFVVIIGLLKIFSHSYKQEISKSLLIREIVYGLLFMIIIFLQSEAEVFNPIVLWIMVLGLIIGIIQSLNLKIGKEGSNMYTKEKNLFYILWVIVFLFIEFSVFLWPDLLNLAAVSASMIFSILLGFNFVLFFKIKSLQLS